jgi:general secretion pathway protein D
MAKQSTIFQPSALVLALSLSLAPALSGLSLTHAAPPVKKASSEPITLNFVNAEIESVARTLATLSNRNLVVDPRVKGTINLTTELPVSPNEAWNQFLAALRLQGFAMVETKGLYKIVPEADAKLQGGSVQEIQNARGGSGSGQIVTHIFKLNFEQANNLLPVLRPLISPNNTINVNPSNNSIIITDYADNLQRMARIIATLDVSNASDVEVIQLKHAIAVDLAPLVIRLIDSGSANNNGAANATPGQTGSEFKTTLLAEPRSNALILRAANPARVALVKSLVTKLDQPSGSNASGNIHVVYLKNADATKLAATLRAAVSGQVTGSTSTNPMLATTSSTPMATTPPATPASTVGGANASTSTTTGGQIQADTATNSLIITAPEPQYRQLRAVIDMLDQRRAQVMVESLIAEVNADKAAQMGIQWQTAGGHAGGSVGVIGTNFNNQLSTTIGQGNIINTAGGSTALNSLGGGLNIGTAKQINGTYVLTSLATFLQQNGEGNVLSTPTLLTLDNEEAKIVVGQNVPFVTGQYTNNNTTNGSVNPFQTVERKDVGLTLKVKPQISETGTVKLTIFQEVSSVVANSVGSSTGLITNKRSIESNVLVDDGSIVVLGGLLSDEYAGASSQVPGLGDIPVLGWLFKSESRSRSKKNLMVFLRPVVVRDAAATDALSNNRYQQMMGMQQNAQPGFNPILGSGNSPVLPPAPVPKPKEAPKASDNKADAPASTAPAQ